MWKASKIYEENKSRELEVGAVCNRSNFEKSGLKEGRNLVIVYLESALWTEKKPVRRLSVWRMSGELDKNKSMGTGVERGNWETVTVFRVEHMGGQTVQDLLEGLWDFGAEKAQKLFTSCSFFLTTVSRQNKGDEGFWNE